VKKNHKKIHSKSKRKLLERLENNPGDYTGSPILSSKNIRFEMSEKMEAIHCGGIGSIHLLANKLGLIKDINNGLHLLKKHKPYFESDHVLNMAYNLLAGGEVIDDLERLRSNPAYMDSLGAKRIPDPSTAGDFLRRFSKADIENLMDIFNDTRKGYN